MKPTKSRLFCLESQKGKIRFETEIKANTFLRFNADKIEEESGVRPTRSYFCIACNCWHITSKKELKNIKSKTEIILEKFHQEVEEKKKKNLPKANTNIIKVEEQKEEGNQQKENKSEKADEKKLKAQRKENSLIETKTKREKLTEQLFKVKSSIDSINSVKKYITTDEFIKVISDSISTLKEIEKTILELELLYERDFSVNEIEDMFSGKKIKIKKLEEELNNMMK